MLKVALNTLANVSMLTWSHSVHLQCLTNLSVLTMLALCASMLTFWIALNNFKMAHKTTGLFINANNCWLLSATLTWNKIGQNWTNIYINKMKADKHLTGLHNQLHRNITAHKMRPLVASKSFLNTEYCKTDCLQQLNLQMSGGPSVLPVHHFV